MANTTIFGDTQKNIQKMLPPKDKNNKESNISNTKDKIIKKVTYKIHINFDINHLQVCLSRYLLVIWWI